MRPPCETIVKYILPMIRAFLAKELIESGLTQEEAAQKLGLTQSAISRYIKEQRGITDYSKDEELISSIENFIKKEGGGSKEKLSGIAQNICEFCMSLRDKPELTCIPKMDLNKPKENNK